MWFFRSPTIVFGEEALLHIRELRGERAFVVTDKNIRNAGLLAPVLFQLEHAGMQIRTYDEIEPEPSLQTVEAAVDALDEYDPDWIVAVGGGSVIDAAKAMWVLFENPDLELEATNPIEPIKLRERARLIAIPTTAGTGSEATWTFVMTDPGDGANPPRKIGSGHPTAVPDYAIVDPIMSATLPEPLTADSGMDALTQAIEGYVATWANDFTDGLCLVATKLAFEYLPRAYRDPNDIEAREKMANCAAMGGLGYINSMVGLAHSMGHALGARFGIPHGRAVGLCLSYVIEFSASEQRPDEVDTRYYDITRFIGLDAEDERSAGMALAKEVRRLAQEIDQPLTLEQAGITREAFDAALDDLVDTAMGDTVIFASPRQPTADELRQLFVCAYEGTGANF